MKIEILCTAKKFFIWRFSHFNSRKIITNPNITTRFPQHAAEYVLKTRNIQKEKTLYVMILLFPIKTGNFMQLYSDTVCGSSLYIFLK